MAYADEQKARAADLIKEGQIFNHDKGKGEYNKKQYDHILSTPKNNIYNNIADEVLSYYYENDIRWWRGDVPGNTMSSQIACLNHLFPIRNSREDVLSIVRQIRPDIEDVLEIETDKDEYGLIQFEAVGEGNLLKERTSTRGANCTSIDALIYAKLKNGDNIVFIIEWKYIEDTSGNCGDGEKGQTRRSTYDSFIKKSKQLKSDNSDVIYYYQPFYQLMRQTLWAEQLIERKDTQTIKADQFMHLLVIPKENKAMLDRRYRCTGKTLEESWRAQLNNQEQFRIISPEELMAPVCKTNQKSLCEYLRKRYW